MNRLLAGITLFLTLTGITPPPLAAAPPTTPIPTKIDPPPLPLNMPTTFHSDEQGVIDYGNRMVGEQCQAQSPVFWCKGQADYDDKHPIKILDGYEINEVSRKVHDIFRYQNDAVDSWRVHSWEVMNKMHWFGDCDDLASTTLDMLIRAGMPLNHIWFLLVNSQGQVNVDHLIAMTQDKDGHYWIVGDTFFPSAYPLSQIKHRVLAVARGDDMDHFVAPEALGIFDPMTMVRVIPDQLDLKPAPDKLPQQAIDLKHPLVPVKRH